MSRSDLSKMINYWLQGVYIYIALFLSTNTQIIWYGRLVAYHHVFFSGGGGGGGGVIND